MAGGLASHLLMDTTTLCRAWKVVRRDGGILGFTDHDLDLVVDGVTCSARTGLSARSLQQTTGLSVDNSEAVGALTDAAVREEDILAGRYDDAEVTSYLVNWQNPNEHEILFRGTFGEITREQGAFRVELRGLAERLNVAVGRAYVARCSAQLGDRRCGIDLTQGGRTVDAVIAEVLAGNIIVVTLPEPPLEGWFAHGMVRVKDGMAQDLMREIRLDEGAGPVRRITVWHGFQPMPAPGDRLALVAGCDRRASTCRNRFDNILNFRGFPHVPGDDWLRRPPDAVGGAGARAGADAGFDLGPFRP